MTTVALPHLHTAVCALFVKVGARFEIPDDNGLSHFVEHMLFRGHRALPDLARAQHRGRAARLDAARRDRPRLHAVPARARARATSPPAIDAARRAARRGRGSPTSSSSATLVLEEINEDYDEEGVEINADDIARGLVFERPPARPAHHRPAQRTSSGSRSPTSAATSPRSTARRNANLCVAGPVAHGAVVDAAARALAAHARRARAPRSRPRRRRSPGPQLAPRRATPARRPRSSILFRASPSSIPRTSRSSRCCACSTTACRRACTTRSPIRRASRTRSTPRSSRSPTPRCSRSPARPRTRRCRRSSASCSRLLDGLRRGKVTDDELAKARVRYRYETLASIDDAAAMAGWFGGTALYYPPPSLSRAARAMARGHASTTSSRVAEQVLAPGSPRARRGRHAVARAARRAAPGDHRLALIASIAITAARVNGTRDS